MEKQIFLSSVNNYKIGQNMGKNCFQTLDNWHCRITILETAKTNEMSSMVATTFCSRTLRR
jgi:hypothetical protein